MQADVASDRVLKVGNGGEHAASDAFAGDGREEALDGVDPGCRGRGEVEHPARMFCQPRLDLRMFVRGVVVGDGMDELARRDGALDGVEELDELLMGRLRHTAAHHGAVESYAGIWVTPVSGGALF